MYAIDDLADLKGRKFQKKRNHVNRFRADHPEYKTEPLTPLQHGSGSAHGQRLVPEADAGGPHGNYLLENIAMTRAFQSYPALNLEGLLLTEGGQVLAITFGSRLSNDTFDIHFEKAREEIDGAYSVINCEFARYLRMKYPDVGFLNREDDLGLEGLRKAKLSYNPAGMVEKSWAYLRRTWSMTDQLKKLWAECFSDPRKPFTASLLPPIPRNAAGIWSGMGRLQLPFIGWTAPIRGRKWPTSMLSPPPRPSEAKDSAGS